MADEIIGRREELLALDGFLEAVPAGGPALLLEGDAGIGKTVLWREGVRLARERGFGALTARSTESELQVAFATIGDLFAPVLDETLPRLPPVQRRALETAFLLRETDGPPPETRLLAAALLSVVHLLARSRPVLVAVDDVQWVDPSSAEIVGFMLRRLENQPVGVLATVRGRPVDAPLGLDRAFPGFRRLSVEPVSVGAVHRLLWGRLALNLPRPVLVRVHETAGGNPFFALELGRALVAGTIRADDADVALPESLRALVAARLGALPSRVRETLVAVAALAAPSVQLLEPLAPTTVDDLELAVRRRVVEFDGDRVRFTHPLLAPACYSAMPLHKRRRLHRRLAELDIGLEERARHLAISATGPDEKAAAALDTAASHAHARGAAQATAELAERAVALTPAASVEKLNRRRITAAERWLFAGDVEKARALLEGTVASSPPGPVRAEALSYLAWVRSFTEGFRSAERIYLRALREPGIEVRQKVDVLSALAWMAGAGGDNRKGALYAEAALALAEELDDPQMLAASLATAAELTFWRTGCIRRDLLDRALEIERTVGAGGGAPRALARLLSRSDRYEEARAVWRDLIADATERADPAVVGDLLFLARMELASGDWNTATRICDEMIQLARQTGREASEPLCLMLLSEIHAYKGEAERARREIRELLPVAERAGHAGAAGRLRRALAALELSCDDAGSSWRQAAPFFADVEELDEHHAQVAGSVAIEALIGTGDHREAERLLALLEERAATADTALRSLAARCRGLLLAARGDYERAIELLEEAAVEPDPPQGVNPFELARTLLALGTVQRLARHKRDAHETIQRAIEVFERLGARLWAEKAHSELRRIGGRTPSGSRLSETERRIVELVVAGRRNREVAAELHLSPNTVAWNLSKVYRKLGVSSRTELAARIAASPHE